MQAKKRIVYVLLFSTLGVWAQDHKGHNHSQCPEVESVKDWFSQGHFHGHVRNYFMATLNHRNLRDYYTNATGGAVSYQTAYLKGFALGVKGIFSYNTFGNNLTQRDNVLNQVAKWELELFDVNRPEVKNDLDRLEELFVQYKRQHFQIALGKIDINESPLLLRRDGRMNHFVYQGVWSSYEKKSTKIKAGIISGVSPRGMTEWFNFNEAIGLNSNGFTYDGQPAAYHEKANTLGMLVVSAQKKVGSKLTSKLHSYTLHNIMQTTWAENEWQNNEWFLGAQLVNQVALPKQKELTNAFRYKQSNGSTWALAVKLQKKVNRLHQKISVAYLRVGKQGRFLYPKELSRENFYVSQPRSWIDGFGDLHVYQIGTEYNMHKNKDITASFYTAYFDTPNAAAYTHNKYGVNAYWQNTLSIDYHFHRFLEGLECTLLLVNRSSPFDKSLTESENFYRNNFNHINFIINLNF